jgi:hypothetical protein
MPHSLEPQELNFKAIQTPTQILTKRSTEVPLYLHGGRETCGCLTRIFIETKIYEITYICWHILFRPRTLEQVKQPLLGNGYETGSRFLMNNNRRPLLGNGSVNMFPQQRRQIRERTVLSSRVVPRSDKKDDWDNQVSSLWKCEESATVRGDSERGHHSDRT